MSSENQLEHYRVSLPYKPNYAGQILIVDDKPEDLALLDDILSEAGHDTRPATDGLLALRSAQAKPPDLILLDITLPGMGSYETCRRLKSDERTCFIPVIFVGILEDERDKFKGFEAGGADYIPKPFRPEEVLARIEPHLRLRELTVRLKQEARKRVDEPSQPNQRLQQEPTEGRTADAPPHESEQRYRDLIQTIQAAVVVHGSDTRILTSNHQAQRLLGLTEDQLRGKAATAPDWHFARKDGTRMPNEEFPVNRVLATKRSIRDVVIGVHRPDQEKNVWALVGADPVFHSDGTIEQVVVTFVDITARKQAEEALRTLNEELERRIKERTDELQTKNAELELEVDARSHQQQFLEALLESTEAGVVACDADGVLTLFNRKSRELHGLPQAPIPADEWAERYDLFLPNGKTPMRKEDIPLFRALQGERVENDEMTIVPRGGEARTLLASGQLIRGKDGRTLGAVVAMHDITERKRAEERLRQHGERLEESIRERTAELEKANAALLSELVERKRAEEALQKSEALLNASQHLAKVGGWEFDIQSGKTFWSEELYRIHEIPNHSPIDHLQNSLHCYRPEDRPRMTEAFEKACENGEPYDMELPFTTRAGNRLWIRTAARPVYEEGKVVRLVGSLMDITDRKQAEEALVASESELRTLISAMTDVAIVSDSEGRYIKIVDTSPSSLLYKPPKELLGKTLHEVFPKDQADFFLDHILQSLDTQKPVNIEYNMPIEDQVVWFNATISPMAPDRTLLVARDITERKRAEEALRESEERYRQVFENSPLSIWEEDFSGVRAFFDDLRTKGVTDIEIYFSQHPEAVQKCAAMTRVVDVNQAAVTMHAAADKEELLAGLINTFTPESFDTFRQELVCLWNGETEVETDAVVRTLAGDPRDVTIYFSVCPGYEGTLSRVLVSLTDITERRRAEQERLAHLRFVESMDRVNRAIQGTSDHEEVMSDVLDIVLDLLGCDRAYLMYPCDPEAPAWNAPMERNRPEYPGVLDLGVEVPMDREVAETLRILLAADGPVAFGPKTGRDLPADVSTRFGFHCFLAMAIHPRVGKPWQFGIHQCSHPRIWTEEEESLFQEIGRRLADALTGLLAFRNLRDSEAKLAEAQRLAHIGNWELDLTTNALAWSDEIFRIFEIDPKRFGANYEAFLAAIHPDDRESVNRAYTDSLANRAPYTIDHRLRFADGRVKWVHEQCQSFYDADGRPIRSIGTVQDITARKRAEELRHQQEQEFRALVENSQDIIARYDRDCRRTYVNPAYLKSARIPRGELLGTAPAQRSPLLPAEAAALQGLLRQVLDSAVPAAMDLPMTKEGDPQQWFNVHVVPEFDQDGRVESVLSISRDITERKRAEREREALIELLHAINTSHDMRTMARSVVALLGRVADCEAVGFRLRDGEDFPYFETRGFSDEFVHTESRLCPVDAHGDVVHDGTGSPVLECMCGDVLCGRFDPYAPFFTTHGSFWTNDTTGLLDGAAGADRQPRARDRCTVDGYQSVALLPLRAGEDTIGLLQFNDRRQGRFSPDKIEMLERFADHLALGLAQQRAEAALRASEERYRTVANFTYDWEKWIGPAGEVLYCSPACERITGYRAEEFVRDPSLLTAIVHPDDRPRVEAHHAEAPGTADELQELEYRIRTRGGEERWLAHACRCVRGHDGTYLGRRVSNRDVTFRRRAEDRIRQLNLELEQRVKERTAELVAANKELEAFSYSVSHDLRAPLRHIDGFVELLDKRTAASNDERCRHYMATISDASKRMGVLIDDLLSFTRMGRQAMTRRQVDLGALVHDIILELAPEAGGRNINWLVAALPMVSGDYVLLRAALLNLISNALKFTRPREIAEIKIGYQAREAETVVFVSDNGVGFEPAYVDRLFNVFQRLHHADEFEGTGIGLANVRRIINRHGGRTWAEGNVDQGATFYFSLPSLNPAKDS